MQRRRCVWNFVSVTYTASTFSVDWSRLGLFEDSKSSLLCSALVVQYIFVATTKWHMLDPSKVIFSIYSQTPLYNKLHIQSNTAVYSQLYSSTDERQVHNEKLAHCRTAVTGEQCWVKYFLKVFQNTSINTCWKKYLKYSEKYKY